MSVQGPVDPLADDLAHPTAKGQPWDPASGNLFRFQAHLRPRSAHGCSDPNLDLSQRVVVLVDRFACCSGLGMLSCGAAENLGHPVDLVSMLEISIWACRLGGVSLTSSPLLIYPFVTNLGPSKPL